MLVRRLGMRACLLAVAALLTIGLAPAFAATDTVEPPKPEPVLVLKDFKTSPATLAVGGRFKLTLYLNNAVDVDADNVVITVGTSGASSSASAATSASPSGTVPEVVVLGSNTQYAGTIEAMATGKSWSFDLVSNPKGFPGPYSLPVTIQFDSPNGGRITSVQSVGLMFTRTLVFDVGALTYPREATVGVPFNVSVAVKNTNEFDVNGVALSFDATSVAWVSRETTVGILTPGATGQFTAVGNGLLPGRLPIRMTISYKDDYNQTKRIERDFTILVHPRPAPAPPPPSPGALLLLFVRALVGLGG